MNTFLLPSLVLLLASCAVPTGNCIEEKDGSFVDVCGDKIDDTGTTGSIDTAETGDADTDTDTDSDTDSDSDTDTGETGTIPVDSDGDGHDSVETGGDDCDDANDDVYPGAEEACNGNDDDCDGAIDDGLEFVDYYGDADGDGYGSGAATSLCADPGIGYSTTGDDCDDADATVHPYAAESCTDTVDLNCDGSAGTSDLDGDGTVACEDCDDSEPLAFPGNEEVCDDIDNDCNTVVDDDASDALTWYVDSDGDTYGNPDSTETACDAPFGTVEDSSDCDDTDAAVNPGVSEVCNDVDDDCNGATDDGLSTTDYYVDRDLDGYGTGSAVASCADPGAGYATNADDCDDGNVLVHPGGTETCDDVDEDCDGDVDEGASDATTWYRDADNDGAGDASRTEDACTQPSGYVSVGDDCDDRDNDAYPGNVEWCDGVDNDCSGAADDGDYDGDGYAVCDECDDERADINPGEAEVCDDEDNNCDGDVDESGSVGEATWYADSDGDGYGDPLVTNLACSAPTGYVSDSSDCDDGDSGINSGETEVCNSVDDDCDGDVDESGSVGEATWYADSDGDGYGDPGVSEDACDQPSGYESNGDDCDDGNSGINPGETEVCDSVDNNCDGGTDDEDIIMCADSDGDGYGNPDSCTDYLTCSEATVYGGWGYTDNGDDCNDADASVFPGSGC